MRNVRPALSALALVMLGNLSTASAQSDEERASARAAAQQGIQALKAGRYEEAVDLIGRAESVVHAPTHLLYLARAHAKLRRLVRAREVYLKLSREDLPPNASKPFRDAKAEGMKELSALEPELAYVTVVVSGAASSTARVTADDTQVPRALVGLSQPADPGAHKYQALADKSASEVVTVTLAPGAHETITLTLRDTSSATAIAPSSAPPTATPGARSRDTESPSSEASSGHVSGLRIASYVSLGIGVAGLAAGGYFLGRRASKEDDSNSLFNGCNARSCTNDERTEVNALDDQANSAQAMATFGFVAGGVAVAAGVALLVVDMSRPSSATGSRVYPWVSTSAAGLTGSF